jgi:hypothetical protein
MQHRANSHLVESSSIGHNVNLNIRDFPDPEDIYSSTLGAADTSQSFVQVPNVRDGDGNIITPDRYETQLRDGTVVSVNVFLKL